MARIEGAVVVRRSVAEVFEFVADECNEPRYNPRMVRVEQITPGPIGIGARFRAEARTLGRRPAPITIEYTGFEPGRQLASSIRSAAMDASGSLTFTSVPAGTRLSWSWVPADSRDSRRRMPPATGTDGPRRPGSALRLPPTVPLSRRHQRGNTDALPRPSIQRRPDRSGRGDGHRCQCRGASGTSRVPPGSISTSRPSTRSRRGLGGVC